MSKANEPLKIEVADGRLVISIGVSTLAYAAAHSPEFDCEDGSLLAVKDEEQFARHTACELEREEEDGTTPVHRILDEAAGRAAEWSEFVDLRAQEGL